jgi:hypothetical protein
VKAGQQNHFEEASAAYNKAETLADKFGNNFGRKKNVLRAKLKLANSMNRPKETEQILRSMGQVNRDQALVDCELARNEIARIAALREAALANKTGGSKTLVYELAMQMGTKIEAIIGAPQAR